MSMSAHWSGCKTEFLGGPLDGHIELVHFAPTALLGVKLVQPLDGWSWSGLIKRLFQPRSAQVRLAIYELDDRGDRTCYHYLCTQLVCEKQFANEKSMRLLAQ